MEQRAKSTCILLTGVEAEFLELTGEHEFMLTKKGGTNKKGFDELLTDCLIRLGDKTIITAKDVERLLLQDRKKLLVAIRQFSNDHDPNFKFAYEWPLEGGVKLKHEYEVEFDEDNFKSKPYKQQVDSYDQVKREVEIVLPRSGKKVRFTMPDGEAEGKFAGITDDDKSSHTMIEMRKPVYVETVGEGKDQKERLIMVDLKKLSWKDLNFLRAAILEHEGNIDTLLVVKHPKSEKTARLDLVTLPAFFFPSLAV